MVFFILKKIKEKTKEINLDINGCFAEDAQTNRTLENIKVALQERLKTYNIDDINKVNKILKIHGLSKGDFDFVKNIENFINNKLNDISIDSNSNKNEKTIEGIFNELTSPVKKAVGYDMLYRMMKRLYGQDEAKRLSGLMYDFTLAMADSTNINRFYCYSVDASKLITEGRPFGQLHSKPAKRMDSYISALCETIHQLSNHAAGAIAVGSFFFDIAHLLLFKEEITLKQLIEDKKTRKYVENEYQTLTHSLNHLSRSSNESCFTNISVFDRSKIKYLLKEMPHLFNVTLMSKKTAEQVYEAMDVVDEAGAENSISFEDYLVEYIIRLEDLFLDFFDKGDPTKNGIPYRFPIISINISKNKKNEILDKEFLNDFVQKDVYRYNIFTSEGMKLASCCRLENNIEMLKLGNNVNSFGGVGIGIGSHRVVTLNLNRIANLSNTEGIFFSDVALYVKDIAKILKAHKELILLEKDKGLQLFISNGWINMNRMFSTVGIIGAVEMNETLQKKFNTQTDYIEETLKLIEDNTKHLSEEFGLFINIEQIPGETMAAKLVSVDKILLGEENIPYKLYANQFIPLWKEASLYERLAIDGKYNKLLTGGGIVHAQIGEKVTSNQAEQIIKYAIKCGCEHFALNAIYCKCKQDHTSFGKLELCPICGEKNLEYYTRVVGFFTPVSDWNSVRRDWEFDERKFVDLKEIK